MKNNIRIKLLQGLLIGLVTGIISILTGLLPFSKNLELMTLDLRYRNRPQIETSEDIGFIDFDDSSLELYGEWPWPRSRQMALVKILDFYNARSAGYDVFFVEQENTVFYPNRMKRLLTHSSGSVIESDITKLLNDSFQNYDRNLSRAIKQSGNIYLAFYSQDMPEEMIGEGVDKILESTASLSQQFSDFKRKTIKELERTFLPVPPDIARYLYKSIDIDPPLLEFVRASQGLGFAEPIHDSDSIVRNYNLFRYYNKQMIYPITLKMLSDIMDFKMSDIELYPNRYKELKNAIDYKTKHRKDIYIPIDKNFKTLLNWAGTFENTFLHIPFRLISYYYAYNIAKDTVKEYPDPHEENIQEIIEHIYNPIMEEKMVLSDEADSISKEITAAHLITKLLERNLSKNAIFQRLQGYFPYELIERVFVIVSESLAMERAILKNPSLNFVQFLKQNSDTVNYRLNVKEKALYTTYLSHLREVFKNIKWFAGKGRLAEAKPYYFPPTTQVKKNGHLIAFSPVDIEDKIFMIGLTGTDTIDLNPTPFEENCPMVAYHVNFINNVLTQSFLYHPPAFYKGSVTLLLSLFMGVVGSIFSISMSLFLAILNTIGYLFVTYKIWELKGYWLEWIVPVFGIVFTYVTILSINFLLTFLEKRKVKGLFSTMVSPAVLQLMEENPDKFSLTGERKAATTFFSMINGIEDILKSITPDELTHLLGIYLTPNIEIIMSYDGYIDKYEGHIIMADFGVPLDDKNNPWKCAFAVIEQNLDIEAFKYFIFAKYGLKVGVPMGFNYGYVSAGNMGSEKKFQYTVMGDSVNVAARIMTANLIYNSNQAITGEDTYSVINDYVYLRPLDKLLLKGKTKPTAIYNVIGWKGDAYLKLCGNQPVPDFLNTLWTKCPPEKIFSYHRLWSKRYSQTGHPMAKNIMEFFKDSLGLAQILLINECKKEIAMLRDGIEVLKTKIRDIIGTKVEFTANHNRRDCRIVLENWIVDLNRIFEILNTLNISHDQRDEIYQEVHVLLNKVQLLNSRLDNKVTTEEGIEEYLHVIKKGFHDIMDLLPEQLNKALQENLKRYQISVKEFLKLIKEKSRVYHEMMSIVGSPTKEELFVKQCFEEGLSLYWQRSWDAALERFRTAEKIIPEDGPIASFIERIETYKIHPPGDNWQGEFVQTKK